MFEKRPETVSQPAFARLDSLGRMRHVLSLYQETEIVLIDHGLYDYINETDRKNLCKLWKAIILKDEPSMKFYSTLLNVQGNCLVDSRFDFLLLSTPELANSFDVMKRSII